MLSSRTPPFVPLLLLTALLSACASIPDTDRASASAVSAALSGPTEFRPPPLLSDDNAEPEAPTPKRDEPTLIRGNDRMFVPPKAPPVTNLAGGAVSLKFEQAPVTEVVHAVLGDILKVPYVINQPVSGAITLHTEQPLGRDKVFAVLESVLAANGLAVVKDAGGVYHVGRAETLRGVAPSLGSVGRMAPGQSIVIVPLHYVGAAEMADILKPLANPENFVRVDTFRNLLMLAGSKPQIEGWMQIVNTFDIDILKGMSIGLFPLKYSSAREVDAGLKAMLAGSGAVPGAGAAVPAQPVAPRSSIQGQGGARGAAAPPVPEAAAVQLPSPIAGVVRLVVLESLNALLVITPRAHYLDIAREWIDKFDQPRSGGHEPQLYVYPVQNGTARHLAGLLNAVFAGEAQTTGSQTQRTQRSVAPTLGSGLLGSSNTSRNNALMPRLGSMGGNVEVDDISQVILAGNVRVVADEQQNALLIHAPQSEYDKIEAALRRLDVAPTQVLIEASILEVTLNDELKFGLQWYFSGRLNSSGTPGLGQLTAGSSDTIARSNPGFSYTITNSIGGVRAILNALAEKSLLNVISSPSVMVLDNHTAQIHVGDQQPIRSSSTVTDGGTTTTSIQYKDTGVMLAVSPSVNAGGMVTMEIEQSVTDVGQIDLATEQRAFLQRQISSRVAVRDGETIVLGGLIRDNNTNDRQGIPILHDIPVIGHLFGSTTLGTKRTELLVMITPRVIKSEADLRQVGDEMRMRMRTLDLLPERISADFNRSALPPARAQEGVRPLAPTDAEVLPLPMN